MKKTLSVALLAFGAITSFAQGHIIYGSEAPREGGRYLKRVENIYANHHRIILSNGTTTGVPSLDSKQRVDRRFFGDFNAKVEYFFDPSFYPAQGLRIYRDSLDSSYLLEIKTIADYKKVNEQVDAEFPLLDASIALPKEQLEKNVQHNRAMLTKQWNEQAKRYRIDSKIVTISDSFAEKVYTKTATTIDTFTQVGPPAQASDGYQVTFRCIVNSELWTFTQHVPEGEIEALSNLFREIIADVQADSFDEAKYLNLSRLTNY